MQDPAGLPELYQTVSRSLKQVGEHILEHLSTVHPRNEDLPIGFNDADGADPVSGIVSVLNGATARIVIAARDGHTLHLSSVVVKPTLAAADLADFPVQVRLTGRVIQRIHEATHKRPAMLDRKDKLVIEVTNNSGADANISYFLDGWLRRNVGVL